MPNDESLSWEKLGKGEFKSTCGRYRIWVESRSPIAYAAERIGESPWIGDTLQLKQAKEACEEHAKEERRRPTAMPVASASSC